MAIVNTAVVPHQLIDLYEREAEWGKASKVGSHAHNRGDADPGDVLNSGLSETLRKI